MTKDKQFYDEFLRRWTPEATRILSGIARRLTSMRLDVGTLESEDWGGYVSWYFDVRRHSDVLGLLEEGFVQISIGFHPIKPEGQLHEAGFSLMTEGGMDVGNFPLAEAIDLADEPQVEMAMQTAAKKAGDAEAIMEKYDWGPEFMEHAPIITLPIEDPSVKGSRLVDFTVRATEGPTERTILIHVAPAGGEMMPGIMEIPVVRATFSKDLVLKGHPEEVNLTASEFRTMRPARKHEVERMLVVMRKFFG
jgi:hypothetical protein